MMVAPFFAENSEATFRAMTHGSSFQAPRAQPNGVDHAPFDFVHRFLGKVFEFQRTGEVGESMSERFGHGKIEASNVAMNRARARTVIAEFGKRMRTSRAYGALRIANFYRQSFSARARELPGIARIHRVSQIHAFLG